MQYRKHFLNKEEKKQANDVSIEVAQSHTQLWNTKTNEDKAR